MNFNYFNLAAKPGAFLGPEGEETLIPMNETEDPEAFFDMSDKMSPGIVFPLTTFDDVTPLTSCM
jgi:hypothetical protein